eukprot:TRINITY_DN15837_c0_g1_i1.p1 TRINITY_DN15837_c0_g1~~TRINITY_DN15837_c0_g1_i1.p1  ORF type:complete len:1218 (+),score=337.82 TRINITY_DN15837_c0_g1_i1:70-3723(+)
MSSAYDDTFEQGGSDVDVTSAGSPSYADDWESGSSPRPSPPRQRGKKAKKEPPAQPPPRYDLDDELGIARDDGSGGDWDDDIDEEVRRVMTTESTSGRPQTARRRSSDSRQRGDSRRPDDAEGRQRKREKKKEKKSKRRATADDVVSDRPTALADSGRSNSAPVSPRRGYSAVDETPAPTASSAATPSEGGPEGARKARRDSDPKKKKKGKKKERRRSKDGSAGASGPPSTADSPQQHNGSGSEPEPEQPEQPVTAGRPPPRPPPVPAESAVTQATAGGAAPSPPSPTDSAPAPTPASSQPPLPPERAPTPGVSPSPTSEQVTGATTSPVSPARPQPTLASPVQKDARLQAEDSPREEGGAALGTVTPTDGQVEVQSSPPARSPPAQPQQPSPAKASSEGPDPTPEPKQEPEAPESAGAPAAAPAHDSVAEEERQALAARIDLLEADLLREREARREEHRELTELRERVAQQQALAVPPPAPQRPAARQRPVSAHVAPAPPRGAIRPATAPPRRHLQPGRSECVMRRSDVAESLPNCLHLVPPPKGMSVPCRRERHTAVSSGGKMYVWGGRMRKGGGECDGNLFSFNMAGCAWKRVPCGGDAPVYGRSGHTAVLWQGALPWPSGPTMIVCGGGGPQMTRDNDVYVNVHSPEAGRWGIGQMNRSDPPVSLGQLLQPSSYSRDLLLLDLPSKRWRKVQPEALIDPDLWRMEDPPIDPSCVRRHSAVVHGGRMWLYGGVTPRGPSNVLLSMHLRRLLWVPTDALDLPAPPPLCDHTAVTWGGVMWVYGGTNSDAEPSPEVWGYAFGVARWSPRPTAGEPPAGRSGHSAVVAQGRMLVYGGRTGFREFDDACYSLDFASMSWRQVELTSPAGVPGRHLHSAVLLTAASAAPNASSNQGELLVPGEEIEDDEASDALAIDDVGDDADPDAPLKGRMIVFGGGAETDKGNYSQRAYRQLDTAVVCDFDGGWSNPHPVPGVIQSLVPAPDPKEVEDRMRVVNLPMRFMKPTNWRLDGTFEPVEPVTRGAKGERVTLDVQQQKELGRRLGDADPQLRRQRLTEMRDRLLAASSQAHADKRLGKKKCTPQKFSQKQQEESVQRMYHRWMSLQPKKLEQRMLAAQEKRKPMTADQEKDNVKRLFDDGINRRNAVMQRLRKVHLSRREEKLLSRRQEEKLVSKLYTDRVRRQQQARESLLQKYTAETPRPKLDAAKTLEVTNRLYPHG